MSKTTIEISANNAFELSQKKKVLEKISNLSMQEIERIGKISQSEKAKDYINNKWLIVKGFFKIK